MKVYSIGEAETLLGVKAHVLRYWETIVPGIAPQKDESGKRIYSFRDLERFSRLKYLIQEKKYTIEGARDALLAEEASQAETSAGMGFTLLRQLSGIRSDMIGLYQQIKNPAQKEGAPDA